jgi:hypothetical protein
MESTPPPRPVELDFSRFHDLMHTPFTANCWSLYGGPRHHLTLYWRWVARPMLLRNTLCRLGRHRWTIVRSTTQGQFDMCGNCDFVASDRGPR